MTLFCIVFVICFLVNEAWEAYLTIVNQNHIRQNAHEIPHFYQNKITEQEYQKGIAYNLEKSRFGLRVNLIKIIFLVSAIGFGFFEIMDQLVVSLITPFTLHHSVAYCLSIAAIMMLLQIPASLYSQFVIEEKYGFNKMTGKLFVIDFIKGLALGAALGIPLLYLVFWLYHQMGSYWWLYAFLFLFGFQLFIAAIYPTLLAPLFNKFTPLANGELKEQIIAIAEKINFKMSGIYTIDGSKRSAHSNAYFAGMGKMRRIVLFDTLVDSMSSKEILSVLAHEMGHNIKKHIQKSLVLSFVLSFFGFWILSLVINWPDFYTAFGAGNPSIHKAFVLFSLFSGYFTFWLTPVMNYLSRRNEYEADAFSVATIANSKDSMISSLIKLSKENLANLTPHPWYSFYYYSHPTTLERVQAIEKS